MFMIFNFREKRKKRKTSAQKGSSLILTIIIAAVASIFLSGLVLALLTNIRLSRKVVASERAFYIAEAGIEYYLWRLQVEPRDFQDGTAAEGPYVHEITDQLGRVAGTYELELVPSEDHEFYASIQSTGRSNPHSNFKRTIDVKLSKNGLAPHALISNSPLMIPENMEIRGNTHTNETFQLDGEASGIVKSAVTESENPESSGDFNGDRAFEVDAIDFDDFDGDWHLMKQIAQDSGEFFANSVAEGYHVVFNGSTFTLYKVNTLDEIGPTCSASGFGSGDSDWSTWSIGDEELVGAFDIPENGIIYIEDNVWVDGNIAENVTLVSGEVTESPNEGETEIVCTPADSKEFFIALSPETSGHHPPFGQTADTVTVSSSDPITRGYITTDIIFEAIPESVQDIFLKMEFTDLDLHGDIIYSGRGSLYETFTLFDIEGNELAFLDETYSDDDDFSWELNLDRGLVDEDGGLQMLIRLDGIVRHLSGRSMTITNSSEAYEIIEICGEVSTAPLPSDLNSGNIIINNDIRNLEDENPGLGLIAHDNVLIGADSEDDLRIDAAIVAANGGFMRNYYPGPDASGENANCGPYHERDYLEINGMIVTNEPFEVSFEDGNGYDQIRLLYNEVLADTMPPYFPFISGVFGPILWQEIRK